MDRAAHREPCPGSQEVQPFQVQARQPFISEGDAQELRQVTCAMVPRGLQTAPPGVHGSQYILLSAAAEGRERAVRPLRVLACADTPLCLWLLPPVVHLQICAYMCAVCACAVRCLCMSLCLCMCCACVYVHVCVLCMYLCGCCMSIGVCMSVCLCVCVCAGAPEMHVQLSTLTHPHLSQGLYTGFLRTLFVQKLNFKQYLMEIF